MIYRCSVQTIEHIREYIILQYHRIEAPRFSALSFFSRRGALTIALLVLILILILIDFLRDSFGALLWFLSALGFQYVQCREVEVTAASDVEVQTIRYSSTARQKRWLIEWYERYSCDARCLQDVNKAAHQALHT